MRSRRLVIQVAIAAILLAPRMAPGTVEEQRARLPAAAHCEDPVTGVWKSHAYAPLWGQWSEFYLDIERAPEDSTRLVGLLEHHSWYGDADQEQPGPCRGARHYRVSMDGRGSLVGDVIEFGGVGEWRLDELLCGTSFVYNLDQFTGEIDIETEEFQSVNNDGGRMVNAPTVFRRIQCHPLPAPTEIQAETPAFFPPRSADVGGCFW